VRSEAIDARDAGLRQLEQLGQRAAELARGFESTQRELLAGTETQAGALRDSGERLAATLARLDTRLGELRASGEEQQGAAVAQLRAIEVVRDEARRRDAELRDAQHAALLRASEELTQTLSQLRGEASAARGRIEDGVGELGPELVARVEAVAERLARTWSDQLVRLEALYERVEHTTRGAEGRSARQRLRDRFRRS